MEYETEPSFMLLLAEVSLLTHNMAAQRGGSIFVHSAKTC